MESTTILAVDDNAAGKGSSLGLRARGYEILCAADALSATVGLVKERPDLVIPDLGHPCGDRFVMMERLQNIDYLAGIPVIELTGREFEFENLGNPTRKRRHRLLPKNPRKTRSCRWPFVKAGIRRSL